ncbi:MAG: hypothetical protein WCB04_09775 [Mycobacteriales bacterium]
MATIKEDPDHLAALARSFRTLSHRTDHVQGVANGRSDFGPGNAHDPALNEQIDWFYRRWVQKVEKLSQFMLAEYDNLDRARAIYELADHDVLRATVHHDQRRVGADL